MSGIIGARITTRVSLVDRFQRKTLATKYLNFTKETKSRKEVNQVGFPA
jgi:hypothetical protein